MVWLIPHQELYSKSSFLRLQGSQSSVVDWGLEWHRHVPFVWKSLSGPPVQKCNYSDVLNATLQVSVRDAELSVDMVAAHSRQSFSQWFVSFLISTLKNPDLLSKNEEERQALCQVLPFSDSKARIILPAWVESGKHQLSLKQEFWNKQYDLHSDCSWQYRVNANLLNRVTLSFRQFLLSGENDSWYCTWGQESIKLLENSYWF